MSQSEDLKTEAATIRTKNKTATGVRMKISRKAPQGMFDTPEIVAVSIGGAALLAIVFAYFFMLLPARAEFVKREAERRDQQTKLADLQAKADVSLTNQNATVDLMGSVERFETKYLTVAATGNAALYARLNQLIRANNLRNTAGPEYAPLEIADATRRQAAKGQSLFPGTGVNVTVEGSYASLRRFVGELENTNQFLIINAVEIESNSDNSGAGNSSANSIQPPVQAIPNLNPGMPNQMPNNFPNQMTRPNQPQPKINGAQPDSANQTANKRGSVSLRLQMAAYFRRNALNN